MLWRAQLELNPTAHLINAAEVASLLPPSHPENPKEA